MMNKKLRQFLAGALVGTSLLSAGQGIAADDLVPYKMADLEDARIKEIWDTKEWKSFETPEGGGYVRIARFKNNKNDDVEISMQVNQIACAKFDCPVRIFVSGELVVDDLLCRFEERHALTRAKNAAFICDTVVSLADPKELKDAAQ